MSLNVHDFSVAVFVRGLTNLKGCLAKAEAHASSHGLEPLELINARLAHDMYDLAVQVHWAAAGAKLAVDHLTGTTDAPAATPERKSFSELYAIIDATIGDLNALDPKVIEAGLERTIEIDNRGRTMTFTGVRFLQQFAIPNFFFHTTTAYAILRQKGVALTKGDFMGPMA